jgi:lysophospholipase L1-like esterase
MKKHLKYILSFGLSVLLAYGLHAQGIEQKFGAYALTMDSLYTHVGLQGQYVIVYGEHYVNDGFGAIFMADSTSPLAEVPRKVIKVTGTTNKKWIAVQISASSGDTGVFNNPDYAVINILTTPPGSPADQDKYLAGQTQSSGAAGAWINEDTYIETWDAGTSTWIPTVPTQGQLLINGSNDDVLLFDGINWNIITSTFIYHNKGDNYGAIRLTIGNKRNQRFDFLTNNIIRGGFAAAGWFSLYYLRNGSTSDSVIVIENGEIRKVSRADYLSGVGGSGTVTTFSSGNLSPLFTTSVANATSTPAQTFTLTNAGANSIFGNNTGSSAAPAYNSASSYADAILGLSSTGFVKRTGSNTFSIDNSSYLTSYTETDPLSVHTGAAAGGDLTGTYPNPTVNTINSITKSYYDPTSSIQTQLNGKEPALGNPASSGYVLSSTTGGVRSWVAQSGGGASLFPLAGSATATGNVNGNVNHLNLTADSVRNFTINQYIDTVANSNTVTAAGYGAIQTSGTDFTQQNAYILNLANATRIRQTGTITTVQFYLNTKPTGTLKFSIWRKVGANYTLISSQDILSLTTATSTNTITLPSSVDVLEGDFTGFSYTSSSSISVFKTVALSTSLRYYTSDPGSSSDFTTSTASNGYVPIFCTMNRAPVMVGIGNSIMASTPGDSYISLTTASDWDTSGFPYKVQAYFNITGQNTGINGNITSQIIGRAATDLFALHPKYALLEGGVNDIRTSLPSQGVIANWISLLQMCKDSSIRPIMILILPWTNGTNAQNTSVDSINTVLLTLAPTYKAIVVDARSAVGQFRSGGTGGNLWDIKPAYDADGIHFTGAGNTAIANVIELAMLAAQRTSFKVDSTGRTIIGGALNVNNSDGAAGSLLVSNGTGLPPYWLATSPWLSAGNAGTSSITSFLGTTDNKSLRFRTNNVQRMIIDSNGNVGIGTNTPGYPLHVAGIINAGDTIRGANAVYLPQDVGTSTREKVILYNPRAAANGSQVPSGSLGLWANGFATGSGTSKPIHFKIYGNGFQNTTTQGYIGFDDSSDVTSGAFVNLMAISSTGNVGIGTTNPGSKLDVQTTSNTTGFYSATGNFSFLNDNSSGNFTFAVASSTPTFKISFGVVALPIVPSTNSETIHAALFRNSSTGNVEQHNEVEGQTTLVAGTKAITISGLTTGGIATVTLVSPSGGSSTVQYQAVCTSNTLTIQANVAAGTINTSDVSVINYHVYF